MTDPINLATRWTDMWNRKIAAADIVSTDCAVHFGMKPLTDRPESTIGEAQLQKVVDGIAARVPGIHYSFSSGPLYHSTGETGGRGIVTLLWEVAAPNAQTRSGIDLLAHEGDRIVAVWSVTGDLRLPPLPQPELW